jgi:hypothetical protein
MTNKLNAVWAAIFVCAAATFCGCASRPPDLVLDATIGPPPSSAPEAPGNGALVVYTAIEPSFFTQNVYACHHVFFAIYDENGKELKQVSATADVYAPKPASVPLPAGRYLIKAGAAKYGVVSARVVIKADQTTRVYLDGAGHSEASDIPDKRAVRLPKGEVAGWKAGP